MTEEAYNQKRTELAEIFETAREEKKLSLEQIAEEMQISARGNVSRDFRKSNLTFKKLFYNWHCSFNTHWFYFIFK